LNAAKAAFIANERSNADFLFDSGDCIRSGNLAMPLSKEPAWELLQVCGCDAGTLGNRETHPIASAFRAKISGAHHTLLCANISEKNKPDPLPKSLVIEKDGYRVGVLGVMVPMVTKKMASQAASAFLWEDPIQVARELAISLRENVDLLIALTHIGFAHDEVLASRAPMIDLVLGGHSHTVLREPVRMGNTWIAQGGSHAKYLGRYVWTFGKGLKHGELLPIYA